MVAAQEQLLCLAPGNKKKLQELLITDFDPNSEKSGMKMCC
jgi:hypothetical protein